MIAYGEFAYLGTHNTNDGVTFGGNGPASISSSSFHDSDNGIVGYFTTANLLSNLAYNNYFCGIVLGGGGPYTLTSNSAYGTQAIGNYGIYINSSNNNTLVSNSVYSNPQGGINPNSTSDNTFIANKVYSNQTFGGMGTGPNGTAVSNSVFANFGNGLGLDINSTARRQTRFTPIREVINVANNDVLIANNVYSNGSFGIYNSQGTGVVGAGNNVGYSSASVALQNTTAEIAFDSTQTENMILKNTAINPSLGVQASGFNKANSYFVNYSTGLVQVYGDYQLSGSTLTLDYASQIYTSTATNLKVMIGAEAASNFTISTLNDTNAVSQLITIQYCRGFDQQVGRHRFFDDGDAVLDCRQQQRRLPGLKRPIPSSDRRRPAAGDLAGLQA